MNPKLEDYLVTRQVTKFKRLDYFALIALWLLVGVPALTFLLLPSTGGRPATFRSVSKNNLKQIGLATWGFHDEYNHFPVAPLNKKEHAPISWRTALLPYMEQTSLYKRYDFFTRWDSTANSSVVAASINEYRAPLAQVEGKLNGYGITTYEANSQVVRNDRLISKSDIPDGVSNTLMIGEINNAFPPWAEPDTQRNPAAGIGHGSRQFGGYNQSCCQFILVDGSVRCVSNNISLTTLQDLADPADGNVIPEF
ncbi:DUF1559 family PulG-like putative transporter [Calycomorphotria hydatis]|uniref:DUF1559 domain-containing protein n=1 Tax=Calycomorphotria hydatis TaxID=2528027 RepID=A0A517T9K9_9PLAN|nr:DUF1559 domain-containing protein [Calycomorphotria hydatis]QDT65062.1 hypothetical protein V22_23080 [Calycomorphotria hydatis]